jgi:hypothetical protein
MKYRRTGFLPVLETPRLSRETHVERWTRVHQSQHGRTLHGRAWGKHGANPVNTDRQKLLSFRFKT